MITALPRAVVFDLYGTLLHCESQPRSAADWRNLTGMDRRDFQTRIGTEILSRHDEMRKRGVAHPEIQWPEIVAQVAPSVNPARVARFERSTRANAGAHELIKWLRARGIPLALASNAQAYTLDELAESGFELAWFPIHFLSYQRGFSKPDPGVFAWVVEKFASIPPGEILMVGDREDNDILPAQAAGFATWTVTTTGLRPLFHTLKSLAK